MKKEFIVNAPDGTKVRVLADEDATDAELIEKGKEVYAAQQSKQSQTTDQYLQDAVQRLGERINKTLSAEASGSDVEPIGATDVLGGAGALTGAYLGHREAKAGPAPAGSPGFGGGNTPGGKWGTKTGYGIGEGSVNDVSSRFQRAAPQGKVISRLVEKGLVPVQSVVPGQFTGGSLAGAKPPTPPLQAISQTAGRVGDVVGKIPQAMPRTAGAVGGALAATQAADAANLISQGEYGAAVAPSVGSVGGALMNSRNPRLKALGMGLEGLSYGMQQISPLTQYLMQKLRDMGSSMTAPPMPQPRIPEPGTNLPPTEFIRQP